MKYPSLSDLVAMENVEMYMEYPVGEDRKHMRALLESEAPAAVSAMVVKMYGEIQRKSLGYNTEAIDESQGNIHKIDSWDTTAKAMEAINKLLGNYNLECVDLMNDLYDMIVRCEKDFSYGYHYNIKLIKLLYSTLVLDLYEIIDMCICCYTDMLKNPAEKKPKFSKLDLKRSAVARSAEGFVESYRKGDWAKAMKALKDPKLAANESALFGENGEPVEEAGIAIPLLGASAATAPALSGPLAVVAVAAFAILSVKLLIGLMRLAINYFYCKSVSISDYLENQAELLRVAIEAEEKIGETSEKAIKRQKKWLNRMEALSNFIVAKILKTERKATEELRNENKTYMQAMDTNMTMDDANAFAIM